MWVPIAEDFIHFWPMTQLPSELATDIKACYPEMAFWRREATNNPKIYNAYEPQWRAWHDNPKCASHAVQPLFRLYMKNKFLHVWNLVNICDLQATEESSNTLFQLWKYQ